HDELRRTDELADRAAGDGQRGGDGPGGSGRGGEYGGHHQTPPSGADCRGCPGGGRETLSSVGRRRGPPSASMPGRSRARTTSTSWSVPSATGTARRREPASIAAGAAPTSAATRSTSAAWRVWISITSRPARAFSSLGVPLATLRPWSTITI